MPILIAVGILSLLAALSLVMSLTAGLSSNRQVNQLNRIESFYTNEMIAWHGHFRLIDGFPSQPSLMIDNNYSADLSNLDPQPTGSGGGIAFTQPFAPTGSLIRRLLNPRYSGAGAAGSCGTTQFTKSGKKYRVCLYKTAASPAPKGLTIATTYNRVAAIVGNDIYAWGAYMGAPPGVNRVDKSDLPAGAKFIHICGGGVGGGGSFTLNAITEKSQLVMIWCDENSGGCQWKMSLVNVSDSSGKPLEVTDCQGGMLIDSRGRLFDTLHGSGAGQVGEIPGGIGIRWVGLSAAQVNSVGTRCALSETSQVYCYGLDAAGHVDVHGADEPYRPLDLSKLEAGEKVVQLSASGSTQCLRTDLGNVYCFGTSTASSGSEMDQVMFNDLTYPSRKLNMTNALGSKKIVWMFAPNPGVVITDDGTGYIWGNWGGTEVEVNPVPINTGSLPQPFRWSFLTAAEAVGFACGYSDRNDYYCLGNNTFLQLGDEEFSDGSSRDPHPVKKIW